jgi:large subunit ribosomal protein L17
MRHRKKFNHLGRKSAHRKAMLANMASSLILHKRIKTTVAKAKALRMYVEPLITKTKDLDTVEAKMHAHRTVFAYLKDKHAVKELFEEVAGKVADRPGGYTRILKLGNRLGDNAEMCLIELVDYNENMLETKKSSSAGKRTRRGRRKSTAEQAVAAEAPANEEVQEQASESTEAESKE